MDLLPLSLVYTTLPSLSDPSSNRGRQERKLGWREGSSGCTSEDSPRVTEDGSPSSDGYGLDLRISSVRRERSNKNDEYRIKVREVKTTK